MDTHQVYRILLATDLDSQAELLVNALRRSGLDIVARSAGQAQELANCLASESWHLLLAFSGQAAVAPDALLRNLRETRQDLPCLVVLADSDADTSANTSAEELLKLGAAAVYDQQEVNSPTGIARFVHRAHRELDQLEERREKRRTAIALKEIEQRYQSLLDSTDDAIACIHDGLHIYCNKAYSRFFGQTDPDALLHLPFLDLVAETDLDKVKQFLQQGDQGNSAQHPFLAKGSNGQFFPAILQATEISWHNERALQIRVLEMSGNIEQTNRSAELANRDLVSGLPNRESILRIIDKRISEAVYEGNVSAIVVLEFEDYPAIHQLLGKTDCNMFMADFSKLLQETFPDDSISGRISDGGFILVLPRPDEKFQEQLNTRLQQLNEALNSLLPKNLPATLNAGISLITEEAPDALTLLSRAQHNRILRQQQRVDLGGSGHGAKVLKKLRHALDNNQLSPVYQPVVSLHEDGKERYEVRIRLLDDEQLLQPSEFLEAANQHGLGEQLDKIVLEQALQLIKQSSNPELQLIINLTQNSITGNWLLNWLARQLHTLRIPARQLILQFSEIDALSAPEAVESFSKQLDELGCGISVTHFGCALEPFRYLKRIQVQYAKLDRSVLLDIDRDNAQRERLNNLVTSLHAHGILVVAPMVERMELLPLLWQAKVNFVQGNCLQAPSDSMDFSFLQEEEITLHSFQGRSD